MSAVNLALSSRWSAACGELLNADQRSVALRVLGHHPLFAPLGHNLLCRLVYEIRYFEVPEQEFLFQQHAVADSLYLLIGGQLKLAVIGAGGGEKVTEIIRPGETFMEQVPFSSSDRLPLTAQAVEDCRAYAIPKELVRKLFQDCPEFALRLMAKISRQMEIQIEDLASLTLESATTRTARYLLKEIPDSRGNEEHFFLPSPKNVIASRLSIKPETLSRIMSELSLRRILKVAGREVFIKDLGRLKSLGAGLS